MLTSDILELNFAKPAGFNFHAGQFVQFKIPEAGGEVLRSFSIASSPDEAHVKFLIKILPEGKASGRFVELRVGEGVEISAPLGVFTCAPAHAPEKIFIATGTGIAPVRAMIHTVLSVENRHACALLFGLRSEEHIFWDQEFKSLAQKFPNFSYTLTLSRPSEAWAGTRGRVSAHVPSLINSYAEYYICGSLALVQDVRELLVGHKIALQKIHCEVF